MPAQTQITFNEILENPSDLDLNLRYAKEQEVAGRYKSTIASLERLNMLYPENTDIKLYLLSILLKVDSSVRLNLMIETMLEDPNTTKEAKKYIKEIQKSIRLQSKPNKSWFVYADLSYSQTEHSNIDAVSKSKTFLVTRPGQDPVAEPWVSPTYYDKTYSRGASLTVGKKIDSTSAISFTGGVSVNTQNKGTKEINDLSSGSLSYSKVLGKNYILPYLYYSRPNYRDGNDLDSKGFGFNNSYSIDDNKSLAYGASYSATRYNNVLRNEETFLDKKNNETYSANIGYNLTFSDINLISSKISYTNKKAVGDYNSYSGPGLNIGYTRSLPFGNLKIERTLLKNIYEGRDVAVHPDLDRVDKTTISQAQLTGRLAQILPFFKKLDKKNKFFFNIKFTETDTNSTLLTNTVVGRNTSFNIIRRFSLYE